MAITGPYEFTKVMVDGAPESQGVYVLIHGGDIIYIGRAAGSGVSIRSRLQNHLAGIEGHCTQAADQYAWEIRPDPVQAEIDYLTEYRTRYGRLPRCNDRIG